ncbi:hypothetical protein ACET3Z_028113 [Daucus carota]
MMRAFEESSKKVIIETNNLEAFGALDSNIMGASRVEKHNPTDYDSQEALWKCVIKLSADNDPGFAPQFMGEMGFQVVPRGQAQAEMEINDFILEDEIEDVSDDEVVFIVE